MIYQDLIAISEHTAFEIESSSKKAVRLKTAEEHSVSLPFLRFSLHFSKFGEQQNPLYETKN